MERDVAYLLEPIVIGSTTFEAMFIEGSGEIGIFGTLGGTRVMTPWTNVHFVVTQEG